MRVDVALPHGESHAFNDADALIVDADRFGTRIELTPTRIRIHPAPHLRVELVSPGSYDRQHGYGEPPRVFEVRLDDEPLPAAATPTEGR